MFLRPLLPGTYTVNSVWIVVQGQEQRTACKIFAIAHSARLDKNTVLFCATQGSGGHAEACIRKENCALLGHQAAGYPDASSLLAGTSRLTAEA